MAAIPGLFDRARLQRARTLREFDDVFTAPVHGFVDADDYWRKASAKPLLRQVTVPLLLLNARNDPFVPAGSLPTKAEVSASVQLWQPEHGACRFSSGSWPMCRPCRRRWRRGWANGCQRRIGRIRRRKMDDIVKQAMAKWPNVPACYGWLVWMHAASGGCVMPSANLRRVGSGAKGSKGHVLRHENCWNS